MLNRFLPAVAVLLSGCAYADVGQHVVDPTFTAQTQRLLVIDGLDRQWNVSAPDKFGAAITQALARCGVVAQVYEPPALALNEASHLKQMINAFGPDAVLDMQQTSRATRRGDVFAGSYVASLVSLPAKKEVWKASMALSGGYGAAQREDAAADLARKTVTTMAQDGVLRACPAGKPAAG